MKVFSFLTISIVSIILSSKTESEACVWKNWLCDWITGRNNGETTDPFNTYSDLTEDEKMQAVRNISSSINQFSLEFYQAIAKKTNGSFILSPFSAAMVLMMAAYGANPKGMNDMLHLDTNNNTFKAGIYSLNKMFHALDPMRFQSANKIYAGKNQEIESDFESLVNETFESSIEKVDFGLSEETTKKINDWHAEKNRHLISNFIKSDEISADTELSFINSFYFSALWKEPLNETDTRLTTFNTGDGKTVKKPIMHKRNGELKHHSVLDAPMFESEFKDSDDDESMRFIMLWPGDFNDLTWIEQNLHTFKFSDVDNAYSATNIAVPKFRIESTINLEDMLNRLGTDFSSISKQGSELKMNKAAQKLTLEMNESGITTAVHSEVDFANKTGSNGPQLKQDQILTEKPLIFFITYNGTILFIGRSVEN